MPYSQDGVVFNGRRIVHPGAYDQIDANAMVSMTPGSANVPIVIGKADSGDTGVLKWFSQPTAAREYLQGGELATATDIMFSPAPEGGGGCSLVGVMVANTTVKATKTLGNIVTTSAVSGDPGNRIQVSLQDGTLAGTKKYTAYRWDTNSLEVFDNLGGILKIQYVGAQAYAVVTVTVTTGKATKIETKVGADAGTSVVDLSIDLTLDRYKTVQDVVKFIGANSGYTVSYVNYNNASLDITTLDALANVNIKTGGYLTALTGDIEYQINNFSKLVTVDVTGALTNFITTYLTGGSAGTVPSSWATYFDTIKKSFSDVLVVLNDSSTIHAEAITHVGQMEQRNQKQTLFTGGATGETAEKAKQRAAQLNTRRAVLAYPGIYHKLVSDGKVALPAYMTAAMIAGRACGVDPSEPITFDYFNIVSLENNLVNGDPTIDDLISSGVATLEVVENGGIRLARACTTYIGSNNILYKELSVSRGADELSSTMRKTLEDSFVGRKGVQPTPSAVSSKAVEVLQQAIKDEDITAYRNIQVTFVGTAIYVDYEVAYVNPINYVLVTTHFVPEIANTTV